MKICAGYKVDAMGCCENLDPMGECMLIPMPCMMMPAEIETRGTGMSFEPPEVGGTA